MTGFMALDFGTSNTIITYHDDSTEESSTLHIPLISRSENSQGEDVDKICFIPSLINYSPNYGIFYGNQVIEQNLLNNKGTFRWIKRYISNQNPSRIKLGNRYIDHLEAGTEFLSYVLVNAGKRLDSSKGNVIFTVPVESFENYSRWISTVTHRIGMDHYRLMDEPTAAAQGFGVNIQNNDVYLVIDFGGGTLDVSVVQTHEENSSNQGPGCRVLGKSGEYIGGMDIDQYIFREILKQSFSEDKQGKEQLKQTLLWECERAKKELSFHKHAEICLTDPDTEMEIEFQISRMEFEELLEDNNFYTIISQTIMRALSVSREYGYSTNDLNAVLMVGGSAQIPSVQKLVKNIFGKDKVRFNGSMDAVSRGAALFAAEDNLHNHIQYDYAIRHVNPVTNQYEYDVIVKKGTTYPTETPARKLRLKPSYRGQTHLGIPIYQIKTEHNFHDTSEIIFDPLECPRIVNVLEDEIKNRTYFQVNKRNPTFLTADPPADLGEARFELYFNVNQDSELVFTAVDLKTQKVVYRDYPIVKLDMSHM